MSFALLFSPFVLFVCAMLVDWRARESLSDRELLKLESDSKGTLPLVTLVVVGCALIFLVPRPEVRAGISAVAVAVVIWAAISNYRHYAALDLPSSFLVRTSVSSALWTAAVLSGAIPAVGRVLL